MTKMKAPKITIIFLKCKQFNKWIIGVAHPQLIGYNLIPELISYYIHPDIPKSIDYSTTTTDELQGSMCLKLNTQNTGYIFENPIPQLDNIPICKFKIITVWTHKYRSTVRNEIYKVIKQVFFMLHAMLSHPEIGGFW